MYKLCLHIVKIVRALNRAEPGRAEPSENKYAYTAAAGTNKKNMIMLKFPLYLDEAYHKKYTEAAAKQQNKAEEVQNMSKIPTLNIDRAESRHPEKIMYIVAAE